MVKPVTSSLEIGLSLHGREREDYVDVLRRGGQIFSLTSQERQELVNTLQPNGVDQQTALTLISDLLQIPREKLRQTMNLRLSVLDQEYLTEEGVLSLVSANQLDFLSPWVFTVNRPGRVRLVKEQK